MDLHGVRFSLKRVWTLPAYITLVLLLGLSSGAWSAGFLGQAGNYSVFGLYTSPANGTYLNLSNVAIDGNVGEGPYGTGHVFAPTTISGTYFYDPTAQPPKVDNNNITGGVSQLDLSQANADALSAYNLAAGYTPTQTFNGITSNTTITGNGGLNVVQINGDINLSSGENLQLSGGANDFYILNVTGTINLGGNAEITGISGVDPSRVLINVLGTGSTLTTHVDNVINGTILAPYRSVSFDGALGPILAGGSTLTLMSGATVANTPLTEVPEPASILMAFGILSPSMLAIRRRRRRVS